MTAQPVQAHTANIVDLSDAALLRQLIESEYPLTALQELIDRHRATVRAVAGHRICDVDADAVTFDVFVELGRHPQRFASARCSVGIHLIVEAHRRARLVVGHVGPLAVVPDVDEGVAPDE